MTGVLACLSLPFVISRGSSVSVKAHSIRNGRRTSGISALLAIFGLGLVAMAIWVGRAVSVDRLFATSVSDDLRIQILPTVRGMVHTYWPWGTGLGTFKPVYRVHETSSVLMSVIMNHAHNDWLEAVMTAGAPGIALVLAAAALWLSRLMVVYTARKSPNPPYYVRLGLSVIMLFALASISDYHIRTPSISCLMVVAAIWACMNGIRHEPAAERESIVHLQA